jgi:1-deoxy-D-xylulose-5-phosphate reductoisomerase
MVAYSDGSVLAQLGNPDMRTPIAHALGYPERITSGVAPLDLMQISRLEFEPLDLHRFPCVGLAYQALRAGGSAPAVLNAANEIAVAAFLDRRIRFTDISGIIAETLERLPGTAVTSIDDVLVADQQARTFASGQLAHRALSA